MCALDTLRPRYSITSAFDDGRRVRWAVPLNCYGLGQLMLEMATADFPAMSLEVRDALTGSFYRLRPRAKAAA